MSFLERKTKEEKESNTLLDFIQLNCLANLSHGCSYKNEPFLNAINFQVMSIASAEPNHVVALWHIT